MREIWKDIKGYEGLYQVSNMGQVKRLHTAESKGIGNYERKEHLLKQRQNNKGYMLVDLYKGNKREQVLVHRLVATAFLQKPYGCNIINHIDENPKNNNVGNLEWCTQKYNMNYGTTPYRIGKGNSKPIKQLDRQGNIVARFTSAMQAQRETNVSNGCINDCLKGRRKTAGGYIWQYDQ